MRTDEYYAHLAVEASKQRDRARSIAVALEQELNARTGDRMREKLAAVVEKHREERDYDTAEQFARCSCGALNGNPADDDLNAERWRSGRDKSRDDYRRHLLVLLMQAVAGELEGEEA